MTKFQISRHSRNKKFRLSRKSEIAKIKNFGYRDKSEIDEYYLWQVFLIRFQSAEMNKGARKKKCKFKKNKEA